MVRHFLLKIAQNKNVKVKNTKKTIFQNPFGYFPKILVHFQKNHFSKVFFCKCDELSLHSYYKHLKKTFLKTATFGTKVAH